MGYRNRILIIEKIKKIKILKYLNLYVKNLIGGFNEKDKNMVL